MIITAKHPVSVGPSLRAAGLTADELFTHVHGPEKAEVLRSIRAAVYVGDTPPDITAGISAGVRAVGVATGSFTAADLRRAGAQPVLATLEAFPAWYQELNDLHLRGYRGVLDLDAVVQRQIGSVLASDTPVDPGCLGDGDLEAVRADSSLGFDAGEQFDDQGALGSIRAPLEHRDLDDRVVGTPVRGMDEVGLVQRYEALEPLLGRVIQRAHDRRVDRFG